MKLTEQNAEAIGQPILDSILKAHAESDYAVLSEFLSADLKLVLTEEVFKEAIQNELSTYGTVRSTTYLGHLNRKGELQLLWKISYAKGQEDVLWELYLGEVNDKIEVLGLWFG
ncbi:MAG: hypothetical protein JKX83_03030 [Pseudomonadales bacterium]|nr:hypothetical protein [Pseudomonadales bacterium]